MPLDMRPELPILIKGQIRSGLASSIRPAMIAIVPLMPTTPHSYVAAVAASVEAVVQAITPMVQPLVDSISPAVLPGIDPVTLAIQPPVNAVTPAI